MIHIDRNSVNIPNSLTANNPKMAREFEEAKAFFENPEHTRGQRRFRFKNYMSKDIKETLQQLFHWRFRTL